jgi:hypothetical protein
MFHNVPSVVDLNEILAMVTMDIAPLGFELKRIKYVVCVLGVDNSYSFLWYNCDFSRV